MAHASHFPPWQNLSQIGKMINGDHFVLSLLHSTALYYPLLATTPSSLIFDELWSLDQQEEENCNRVLVSGESLEWLHCFLGNAIKIKVK